MKSLKGCYKPKTNKNDIKIENLFEHFNTLLGQESDDNNSINDDVDDDENSQIDDDELDTDITEQEIRKAYLNRKMVKLMIQMKFLLKS